MQSPTLKLLAHQFCSDYIKERIQRLNGGIEDIAETLTTETKSSAGDKHETGRAMMQLEREKLGQQLFEAEQTMVQFQQITTEKNTASVNVGSLVKTDKTYFYIAISAGKFEEEQHTVYCISANAPIAKLLLGKKKGETIDFNGQNQKILEID